jgi:hypothetical protein
MLYQPMSSPQMMRMFGLSAGGLAACFPAVLVAFFVVALLAFFAALRVAAT